MGAAELSQIPVPPVVLFFHAKLLYPLIQTVQALFPLASADDLPDAGHQKIRRRNGPVVIIHAHIKRLDIPGIVLYKYRLVEDLLRQVPLMFGLQVNPPFHRVTKVSIAFLQDFNGIRVGQAPEFRMDYIVQAIHDGPVHKSIEELHLFRRIFQHILKDVFDHILRQIHDIVQIRKGDLRFDHPELRRMSRGIGVFRTKGRSKGIDIAECHGISFSRKLSTHRQISLPSEEVFGIVHIPFLCLRNVVQIQGGYLKHFPGAFTVTAGDNRGMNVDKIPFLEEFMNRKGQQGTNPENSGKRIGSGPQMGDGPQVFKAVPFLLERIFRRTRALHPDAFRLHLKRLLCTGGLRQHSFRKNGRANAQLTHFPEVVQLFFRKYNLQIFKERPVIEFNKPKGFGIPIASNPSGKKNPFPIIILRLPENLLYGCLNRCICHDQPTPLY